MRVLGNATRALSDLGFRRNLRAQPDAYQRRHKDTLIRPSGTFSRKREKGNSCHTIQRGTTMIHKRLRPFNTKETYPEQKLDNDLSQGVVARGTMVFLRGQVAQDLDTRESLHVGDAALQTRKTMENIKLLLE